MTIIDKNSIDLYIKKRSYITLMYFEYRYSGEIIMQSDSFILIRSIEDWHYDGYMIFPKKYISKIEYTQYEKVREKIMNSFSSKNERDDLSWLNIHSFSTIFTSIQKSYNKICIECAKEDINQFMIGKIVKFGKKNLYVNQLNVYAQLSTVEAKIRIKYITCIYFKDEYSSVLFSQQAKGIKE